MRVFIELITFFIIYIYNKFFINYCINLLGERNPKIAKIYPVLMSGTSMILICSKTYIPIVYIIMFFVQMIILKIIFIDSIEVIYDIVIHQIFQMIINRDIVIDIFSIVSKKKYVSSCSGI